MSTSSLRLAFKRSLILAVLLVGAGAAHAQITMPEPPSVYDVFLLPQGNVPVSLSGEGFGGALHTTASGVATGNPAALANFERPALGASWQYGSDVENAWLQGVEYEYPSRRLPQSVGAVLPYGAWRFSIGYAQVYTGTLKVESTFIVRQVRVTSKNVEETKLDVIAPAITYSFSGFWDSRGEGTVGLRIGMMSASHNEEFTNPDFETSLTAYGLNWTVGARYEWQSPVSLQVGISYQGKRHVKATPDYDLGNDFTSDDHFRLLRIPERITRPGRLTIGGAIEVLPALKLNGSLQGVFWQQVEGRYDTQTEWTLNAVYGINRDLSVSLGYWRAGRSYIPDSSVFNFPDPSAHYLSVGTVYRVGLLRLDVAVADSRLFSSESQRQTLVKAGVSAML